MPRRRQKFENPTLFDLYSNLRSDFRAGKSSRFRSRLTGVSSLGSGADYHYRNESQFLHMMELARHYQRNDPVVGQGVRRLTNNVIQEGFRLDVNSGDAGVDERLTERWNDWSGDPEQCHSEGEFTFDMIERHVLSSVTVDGDIFALPLRRGSLELVEAHRCRNSRGTKKNVVHGVEVDGQGRRRNYWFTARDYDSFGAAPGIKDIRQIPARDEDGNRQVFHVYNPYRSSQRRGVTCLAPVADVIGMHDDLQFAALVAAQAQNCWAILHNKSEDFPLPNTGTHGEQTITTHSDGSSKTEEGLAPGMEYFSQPGEQLTGFSPTIPAPQFFQHANLILTFVSVNLDLPLAVLLLDPSNTNFSGWRGAVDQARMSFRVMQRWLCGAFHCHVYRWKVRQWIEEDEELARAAESEGVNIFGHRWNPPTWDYIEPMKDAAADLLQTRNAQNSPRRIQAKSGRTWDEVSTEIVEDNATAIEKAIERAEKIRQKTGVEVHWRELISLPTPDGVKLQLGTEKQDTDTEESAGQRSSPGESNGRFGHVGKF